MTRHVCPIHVLPKLSMIYNPAAWNETRLLTKGNCLAYALDHPELGRPYLNSLRPVTSLEKDISPVIQERLNKSSPQLRMLFSGLVRIHPHAYSPQTHHIIAFSKTMGHFFRLDGDGIWSHKQGATEATNKDSSGHVLTCLERANFDIRPFDHRAFYVRTARAMNQIRDDQTYSRFGRQEVLQRQRAMIKEFSSFSSDDSKIAYFTLPPQGIAVLPQ